MLPAADSQGSSIAAPFPAFVGSAWLFGGHVQTIYPFLRPRPAVAYRRERLDTPDGDFVDFDWLVSGTEAATAPLVVLFHGLEGSSRSHYALELMAAVRAAGWQGVVPHFRGCSGEINRLPRAYHSGDYAEIGWMLRIISARVSGVPIFAVGVSLGGSALLNWLGREGNVARKILAGAAVVSAPLDLSASGHAIDKGANRMYAWHFLKTLKPKALSMAQRYPGALDAKRIRQARSMFAFDDAVTAPLHGFANVIDYWTRASSKSWLPFVGVPTLVLNSRNDPFVPHWSLPNAEEASEAVVLEQPHHGGHCGFLAGGPQHRSDWLPERLLQFFRPLT